MNDSYEQKLLEGWEDVFYKGQLALWVSLALKDGPKHMADIKKFIAEATNNTVSVDDKSMYRALRRYHDAAILEYELASSEGGPDHKIYRLTETGQNVLAQFVQRNILDIFFKDSVKDLLHI
jgi:PadR family transcriptional regulator, regulatory protein PadR